jgi:aminoglycoside phosphotransferase family enzyme/predicted kinase
VSVPQEQAETDALLRRLSGGAPVETHISLVYLGEDTVWKLKKAVTLTFLDFATPEARRHFAERELTLNSAAAPGLYRDVVPVRRQADGSLTLGGEAGLSVDWVLRMARVPAADFLDRIAATNRLTPALLDATADAVAAYHAACPVAHDTDQVCVMQAIATGNVAAARAAGLPAVAAEAWSAAMQAALAPLGPWQRARSDAGFVRRAHGDLHLGNLCLWRGRPVPFDALEFDEAMATIDLGYDLAFLLMDLLHHAGRLAANRVMNRYIARTGDVGLTRGLPAFLSMRAMVRAHIETARGRTAEGAAYLALAGAVLQPAPARVVAVGGLPGTGKSTLARALAPELGRAPGALVLRSDEIRKRRFGAAPETRLGPEAYTEAVSRATFDCLAADLREAAAGGQSVVADATFLDPATRAQVAEAALAAGVPFLGVWLEAPLEVLEARVLTRRDDASDATAEVLRRASATDPGPGDWLAVDARDAGEAVAQVRARLTKAS